MTGQRAGKRFAGQRDVSASYFHILRACRPPWAATSRPPRTGFGGPRVVILSDAPVAPPFGDRREISAARSSSTGPMGRHRRHAAAGPRTCSTPQAAPVGTKSSSTTSPSTRGATTCAGGGRLKPAASTSARRRARWTRWVARSRSSTRTRTTQRRLRRATRSRERPHARHPSPALLSDPRRGDPGAVIGSA